MEKNFKPIYLICKRKELKIVFCLSNIILISTPHCVENSVNMKNEKFYE